MSSIATRDNRVLRPRGIHGRLGHRMLDAFQRVSLTTSLGLSGVWHMLLPRTWKRTVRHEFVRQCWQIGIKALPTTMLTGAIVGSVLVSQVMFWMEFTGGVLGLFKVGAIAILNFVREVTPLLVALIVAGRSGTVMITELIDLRLKGQIHMLDSQGIDLFDYLLVPRLAALVVCTFSLSVFFAATGLIMGELLASAIGISQFSLLEFVVAVAALLSPVDYLEITLKTVAIGLIIGSVACVTPLRPPLDERYTVRRLLPLGFMRIVVAILVATVVISVLVKVMK